MPIAGAVEVVAEVNAAEESVYFSIFSFTRDDLREALIGRAVAGVEVVGVWDLLGASNRFSEDEALCAAGSALSRWAFRS